MLDEFAELRKEGQQASQPPWEMLRNKYAPDKGKLNKIIIATRSLCPFLKEPGVNYMGLQADMPTRSKGHCHPSFFNAFNASSFPQGLCWPDLTL